MHEHYEFASLLTYPALKCGTVTITEMSIYMITKNKLQQGLAF